MARLFTYTIPVDDGAAPNPFNGICTLAICKPGIRRVAQIGDWVAGLGSKNAPSGDLSGCLVYAMHVDEVLTLQEYDEAAKSRWPHRIPDFNSLAPQNRLGDCIYDYSNGQPELRKSVHGLGNVSTDLGGKNVLISRDFYYFGNKAKKLPDYLQAICHQTQGHKSNANFPYFEKFISWIRVLAHAPGQLYGWPDHLADGSGGTACGCCSVRRADGEKDSEC